MSAVRLLVMDVDGVLTDGSIVYDDAGREIKRFHVRDGLWIKEWMALGYGAAVLSARSSGAVSRRMEELGVSRVVQGSGDKGAAVEGLARASGVTLGETAFIGDDLADLAAMRRVGYPMAVADADERVIRAARFVTTSRGGHGAVREAIMHLLDAQGRLGEVISRYDGQHG
jgi:3-deoxy-D-manno-octulosonate 8-phosphate phosphatase (KDO 8-P phosphatase)